MSLTQVTSTMLSGVPIQVSTNGAITTVSSNNASAITLDGAQNATFANTVKTSTITGTTGNNGALAVNASTTFNNTISAPNTFGFKNRIINGGMVIDQRNAGASANNASGAYVFSVDRFKFWGTNANAFKVQQNAGSITPPTGFTNYIGITSLAATTPGSTDQYFFGQIIEGYNIVDIGMGTANAKPISISFWAYSSLTGTFGGALQTSAGTCPFSYTITSANTWTYCTIVTNPNTSYSPNSTTTGNGMWALFDLGSGSTFYGGTANTWGSTAFNSVSGTNKLVSTNGATLYIAGFQLEVGAQATAFDYRPYGTEFALCQRYYYVVPPVFMWYNGFSTAYMLSEILPPVQMRTSPSAGLTTTSPYVENQPWNAIGSFTSAVVSYNTSHTTNSGGSIKFTGTFSPSPSSGQPWEMGATGGSPLYLTAEL